MPVVPLFPARNHLVAALSPALVAELEGVQLEACSVALEPGAPPAYVYFPESCVATLLLTRDDGTVAHAAMIGHEGMLGVERFLGGSARLSQAIPFVHVGGLAWRLSAARFEAEVDANPALRQRLLRYSLALVSQMARAAACRRSHGARQQVARWLLQTLDRGAPLRLGLGAESIANLLGLRRADVVDALLELDAIGLLRSYQQAQTVLDRGALERVACRCYRHMREAQVQALLLDRPPLGVAARQRPPARALAR